MALQTDLQTLQREGYGLLPLPSLVEALRDGSAAQRFANKKLCALTFDDGFLFDYSDMDHPEQGWIPSFRSILLDESILPQSVAEGPKAVAFVIASPVAREELRFSADPEGLWDLREDWWAECAEEGIIAISNHSWDHLHVEVSVVRQREQRKGSFHAVDNPEDAHAQIVEAKRYIDSVTKGLSLPLFCYPYGDVPEYLQTEFLPGQGVQAGLKAAFGTEGTPVTEGSDLWNLPRFVCGRHWREAEKLIPTIELR